MSDLVAFDRRLQEKHGTLAGLDEAGRGALAGPVFVGCISIGLSGLSDQDLRALQEVDDSKQLTQQKRATLFGYLTSTSGIRVGIGQSSNLEIDRTGINDAVSRAARRALDSLGTAVDLVVCDRGISPARRRKSITLTGGDGISLHVAAASVLAKVGRDRYMRVQAARHPQYGWKSNVGYGTGEHRRAIRKHGPADLHRRSYKLA